jgi:hypothetical protein
LLVSRCGPVTRRRCCRQRAGDEGHEVGHFFRAAETAGRVVQDLGQDAGLDSRPALIPAAAAAFKAVNASTPGVTTMPGLTVLTVMPVRSKYLASETVRLSSAALDAA